ncbi:hypothetical protein [Dactylosporangium sp. CS-033363]|uniref:hypothetical protein n=1 Tax=Dactylosporangium sp. CS-033363 TaxID=3239935 RepID=UPI003D8ADB16
MTFEKSPGPWALMEAVAGPDVEWDRVVSGARDLLYRIVRFQDRLPWPFIEAVIALGDGELLGGLAWNDDALARHPGLRERLAATGARQVADAAAPQGFQRRGWELRLRRLVMSRLTEAPGVWAAGDRSGVVAPVAFVARKATNNVGERLTIAERLRAMLSLRRAEGPDTPLPYWLPTVPAEPASLLEGRVAEEEGTAGAIAELLDGFTDHLALRESLDWDAVGAAHAEMPFGPAAAAALAVRADCPEEFRFALFLAQPAAVAPAVPVLTEAMALAPLPKQGAAKAARIVARRAVDDGLEPELLLERMRPAAAVLEVVRLDALGKLVDVHLGADPGKWAWVRAKVNAFKGSVTELLESAGSAAWPSSTTGARAAFVALLDHASDGTQLALLEHLDDKTVHELFTQGVWRDAWVERAVTDPRPALRLALAARPTLDGAAADRLAALGDAGVNGALFRRTGTSHRLRMQLLDGRPFDPEVRAHLLTLSAGFHGTDPLDCADRELQRHLLRHVRVRGKTAQFRLLLNLWHRHGPEAVTELLEDELNPVTFTRAAITPAVRSRVKKVLAARDRAGKLAELEAEIAHAESAAGQIELLTSVGVDFQKVYGETRLWHWDAILAEHRRAPLTGPGLTGIGEARGCPPELAEAGRTRLRPFANAVEAALAAGTTPVAEVIAAPRDAPGWMYRATRSGAVTWDEVLRHTSPAADPLTYIGGDSSDPSGRAALAALVAETCGGDVDAVLLAIRLAPDFPGPAAELLQVAAAAVRP